MQTRNVKLDKLQAVIRMYESMMTGKQTFTLELQQLKLAEQAAQRSETKEAVLDQVRQNLVLSVLKRGADNEKHKPEVVGLMQAIFNKDISEFDSLTPRSKLSVFKFPAANNTTQGNTPAADTSSTLKIVKR